MIDKVLADILQTEISIPAGHIVVNNQNYKPDKDDIPWWVIVFFSSKPIGNSNVFNHATEEQEQVRSW